MHRSKNYLEKKKILSTDGKAFPLNEAVKRLKSVLKDWERVEIAVRLGLDPRKADQNIRGSVVLPHGTGKQVRVAVFAKGEKLAEAREAGADVFGLEEIIAQVQKGEINFDVAIATPDVMKDVSKIGKILGPRGLMPNPKSGTVTLDVAFAIKEFKAGKLNFRVDKAGVVHSVIGKGSFNENELSENALCLIQEIIRLKPASARGTFIRSIHISGTQSPSVKVDPQSVIT